MDFGVFLRPIQTKNSCYIFKIAYWIPGLVNVEFLNCFNAMKYFKNVQTQIKNVKNFETSQLLHNLGQFFLTRSKFLFQKLAVVYYLELLEALILQKVFHLKQKFIETVGNRQKFGLFRKFADGQF